MTIPILYTPIDVLATDFEREKVWSEILKHLIHGSKNNSALYK